MFKMSYINRAVRQQFATHERSFLPHRTNQPKASRDCSNEPVRAHIGIAAFNIFRRISMNNGVTNSTQLINIVGSMPAWATQMFVL